MYGHAQPPPRTSSWNLPGAYPGYASPTRFSTGHNSLSALDGRRLEVLRNGVYKYTIDTAAPPTGIAGGESHESEKRKSLGAHRRGPPSTWYNRQSNQHTHHQRHHSASATLQRLVTSHDDSVLLKTPPRLRQLPPTSRPSSYSHSPHHERVKSQYPIMASVGPVFAAPGPTTFQRSHYASIHYQPQERRLAMNGDYSMATGTATGLQDRHSDQQQRHIQHHQQQHMQQRQQHSLAGRGSDLAAPVVDRVTEIEALPGFRERPPIASYYTDPLPGSLERPAMYNRPRRLSNSSNTTTGSSAAMSLDSLDGRLRSSSWGSQTSIESLPPTGPGLRQSSAFMTYSMQGPNVTATHYGAHSSWHRPAAVKTGSYNRSRPRPAGEMFAALPGEVLEVILEELKKLHLGLGSTSCATCWMRDCCAIALTGRKWVKFARVALYEDVQLVGAEGAAMRKRYKLIQGARLVLLRRTLRTQHRVAVVVRSLSVPPPPMGMLPDEYHSLVASVVMACPNLERLVGWYPAYNHAFSRLFHALATRPRLKEMDWLLEASPLQRQQRLRPLGPSHSQHNLLLTPGDLQPQQSEAFLELHTGWGHLTTLAIHCRPGATLTPDTVLTDTLLILPALRNLHLSRLPATAFGDASLVSLPPLKKLALSHLPGITMAGLSSFATLASSDMLEALYLMHIGVDSLPALARVLSHLRSLQSFAVVQPYAPIMPSDEIVWLFPYLASASLQRLHWDIPYLASRASVADVILARSIAAGGFPAMRALRAPNDPEGIFQALCRPRERVDNPSDRYRDKPGSGGGNGGPNASDMDGSAIPRANSDLRHARLAAQARVEASRRQPRYLIRVQDEEGYILEEHGVGAFLGSVGSNIDYLLAPDPGGLDECGGLVGVGQMLGQSAEERGGIGTVGLRESGKDAALKKEKDKEDEEPGVRVVDGCTGRWNAFGSAVFDKKDRERWWHAERPRVTKIALS